MDTRAAMEAILGQAYDARRRHDAKGAAELFAQDGIFTANGLSSAKGRSEQVSTLAEVFSGFHLLDFEQHCRVIDPPYAVVHWRGTFRMKKWPGGPNSRAGSDRGQGREDRFIDELFRYRLRGRSQRAGLARQRR
jgi:uncharacterized protein (TIGR02246 family)